MAEYTIQEAIDENGEEKIIISSGSLEVWVFEDQIIEEWQIHYKGGLSRTHEWVDTRREAILKALTQIKLLE